MIKQILIVFSLIIAISGCAYRATYFAPMANTENDHTQRSGVFINRGNTKLQVWTQENSDSTWIIISNSSVNSVITLNSELFYIKSGNELFKPITSTRIISTIGEKGINAGLEIAHGKILVVEFSEKIQNLNSFTLYLPDMHAKQVGKLVSLESIKFTKETKWRSISIN